MCGIVGAFLTEKTEAAKSNLERALDSIKHRGPDGQNTWISENKKAALGHVRLSLIDLKTGQQPISSSDGNIIIVVNGEFYDYKKIRAQFALEGFAFKTETDSEILIPLYLKYGFTLFEHLNGEFAFILFDKKKNIMLAARDRFGVKPLSYTIDKNGIVIASEIKAISAFKNKKLQLSHDGLYNFFNCIPSQEIACFEGIKHIKPGHFITIENNKLIQHQYWDLHFNNPKKLSDEKWIDAFRSKLFESVSRRMVADIPVGCYLSGGIDSSSVLSLASQINPNIVAFNIKFTDPAYDESLLAEETAKFLNVDLKTIEVDAQSLADNFELAIFHREAPIYQTCGIAKLLLSKLVKSSGIKAVITGEGADEMLAGYQYFREDKILYENSSDLISVLRQKNQETSAAYVSGGEYQQLQSVKDKLGYIPAFFKLGYDMGDIMRSVLSNQFTTDIHTNVFYDLINSLNIPQSHPVNRSIYIWSKMFFPENILSYLGDRTEMANSVEGRVPFLDKDLADFCLSLPIEMKIRELNEKFILKEAMKGLVPDKIYKRQKHVFAAPPIQFEPNNPLMIMTADTIHSRDFAETGIFDQTKTILFLKNMGAITDKRHFMIAEFCLYLILSTYFLNKHFVR